MQWKTRMTRQIGYGVVLAVLFLIGNISLLRSEVHANGGVDTNTQTIPPPGGTIPLSGAGMRIIHLAPFAQDNAISVVLSGTTSLYQFNNLSIGESTGNYVNLPAGNIEVRIQPETGSSFNLTRTVQVADHANYSLIVYGGANSLATDFMLLNDLTSAPALTTGKIRVVHVAPVVSGLFDNLVSVVQTATDTPVLPSLENLSYGTVTEYMTFDVGHYSWSIEFDAIGITVPLTPFRLNSKEVITLYIIGDNVIQTPTALTAIEKAGNPAEILYVPIIKTP